MYLKMARISPNNKLVNGRTTAPSSVFCRLRLLAVRVFPTVPQHLIR